MAGKLPDYLDHLIDRAYVTTRYTGRLKVSQRATDASIRHYIEDEVTGHAVPVDDSADHFLLMTFHRLREEYLDRPLPVYEEPKPVSGEIPWRVMHSEGRETCYICKEPDDQPGSPFCSRGHLPHRVCFEQGVYSPGREIPLKDE